MTSSRSRFQKSSESAKNAVRGGISTVKWISSMAGNVGKSIYHLIGGVDSAVGNALPWYHNSLVNFLKNHIMSGVVVLSMGYGVSGYLSKGSSDRNLSKDKIEKIDSVEVSDDDLVSGIDISHHNTFNLKKFLKTNQEKMNDGKESTRPFEFVIVRASCGTKKDRNFSQNWRVLQDFNKKSPDDKDLVLGTYHYYSPNQNSKKQFDVFAKTVWELPSGSIAPILDIEQLPKSSVQTIDRLREGLLNRLHLAEAKYGTKPMLYTGQSFYNDYLKDYGFADYPVWIAHYGVDEDSKLDDYVMHQISDKGNVPGANNHKEHCDINNARRDKLDSVRINKWKSL